MQDAMILHICSAAEWQASHDDHYRCASLDFEGFIHGSRPEQVVEVAGRLFQGRRDLVLLVIDPELVTADIRSEDGGNGNFYPHVYGPLNVSAVTSAYALALAQGLWSAILRSQKTDLDSRWASKYVVPRIYLRQLR
jgi:uncharacterized protein (DUF952 family)